MNTSDTGCPLYLPKLKTGTLFSFNTILPEMPIPPESSVIHGITDDMVKDCPTFKQVAHKILRFIDHADLGGFNIQRFDLPLLAEEFLRCDIDFDFSKKIS